MHKKIFSLITDFLFWIECDSEWLFKIEIWPLKYLKTHSYLSQNIHICIHYHHLFQYSYQICYRYSEKLLLLCKRISGTSEHFKGTIFLMLNPQIDYNVYYFDTISSNMSLENSPSAMNISHLNDGLFSRFRIQVREWKAWEKRDAIQMW